MKLILFVLILFFAGFTYLVVTLTNNEIADIRSRAFVEGSIEVESGVISENALLQNDSGTASSSGASGGKYVLLNSILATPTPSGPTPTPLPGGWIEVGVHPQAKNLPGTVGTILTTLEAWNGEIYGGYGDFTENYGPTWITSFDPTTRQFTTLHQSGTDAIWNFRPLQNHLFAPSSDPADTTDYAFGDANGLWQNIEWGGSTHIFDANTLTGSDLWMAGSLGYDAVIWRSIDNGVTWSAVGKSQSTGGVERYYFVGVYKNKLYVQSRIDGTKSKVFDGSTWSTGPNLSSSWWRPIEFAGKMVGLSNYAGYSSSSFKVFDGNSVTIPQTLVYNYAVEGDTLYILHTNGVIKKTKDLSAWTTIATAPTGARSIAVLNGIVYVGMNNAKIFMLNTPVHTLPTVTLLTSNTSATEKGGNATILFARSGNTTSPLTVSYTISGNAANGTDYQNLPSTITIPAGQKEAVLTVQPINDAVTEGNEVIILKLINQTSYIASSPDNAYITIYETPPVSIRTVSESVQEGMSGKFTLTRSGDLTSSLTVSLGISGSATNGVDYSSLPSAATFPAGASTIDVAISSIEDAVEEIDESITLSVNRQPSYTAKLPTKASMRILDDDISPSPNKIINPSFEDGTTSATGWGISGGSWDKTVARTGSASFKVVGPKAFSYIQQGVALTPGKSYIISAYVKTLNTYGRGGGFRLSQTATTTDIRGSEWINDTTDWTRVSLLYTVRADYTSGRLDLNYRLNTGDTVWFDDISIREIP